VLLGATPSTAAAIRGVRAHGLVFVTARAHVQHVVACVSRIVDDVTAARFADANGGRGRQIGLVGVEYRLTALDNTFDVKPPASMVPVPPTSRSAQIIEDSEGRGTAAALSFLRQDAHTQRHGWDVAISVDLVHFPHAASAAAWLWEVEQLLLSEPLFVTGVASSATTAADDHCADTTVVRIPSTAAAISSEFGVIASTSPVVGCPLDAGDARPVAPSARLMLPWSKAWGYALDARRHARPWTNTDLISRSTGSLSSFDQAVTSIATCADPYLVFTNRFMHFALGTASTLDHLDAMRMGRRCAAREDGGEEACRSSAAAAKTEDVSLPLPTEAATLRRWALPLLLAGRSAVTSNACTLATTLMVMK
jgi:hypothetical protein